MDTEPAIVVENLVKRYRKAESNAVDDVSFAVPRGSFFTLLGPNGAGKTTVVSILTTTLAKTSGIVRIAGFDLASEEKEIRRASGVVFQGTSTDELLTGEENIRLHAMLYGLYPFRPLYSLMSGAYKDRVRELSELLGIADDIFRPLRHFSGGMRRKLELVRSLMHQPQILFLDEPTTGLDPQSRRNLWGYLHDVRRSERVTILLTTHYLDEAEGSDAVAVLNRGRIVTYGSPADLKRELMRDELIVDAADRDALRRDLVRFAHSAGAGESAPFRVRLGNGAQAQEIIKNISVPLTVLDIERPTLEDAYLKIIEDPSS